MTVSANSLRAGSAGSVFQIPAGLWAAINQRVYLVITAIQGGAYQRYFQLPNFGSLDQVSVKWKTTTFPAIIALSRQIAQYATQTVTTNYPALQAALAELQTTPSSQSAQNTFNSVLSQLRQKTDRIKSAADALAPDIDTFREVNETADKNYTKLTESSWVVLSPKPSRVDQGLDLVKGAWDAIASDLADLQNYVRQQTSESNPFILNLDIEAAMSEWAMVGQEVNDFIGNTGAQLGYLDGSFILDLEGFYGAASDAGTFVRTVAELPVRVGDFIMVFNTTYYDGRWQVLNKFPYKDPRDTQMLWGYQIAQKWKGFPPGTVPPMTVQAGGTAQKLAGLYGAAGGGTMVRTISKLPVEVGGAIQVSGTTKYDGTWQVQQMFPYKDPRDKQMLWGYKIEKSWGGFPTGFGAGVYIAES